ncbi:ferredoxin-fold anticodon-binding domain-containing protein 1-like isoform X2 [Haemaphysalis longicornis]
MTEGAARISIISGSRTWLCFDQRGGSGQRRGDLPRAFQSESGRPYRQHGQAARSGCSCADGCGRSGNAPAPLGVATVQRAQGDHLQLPPHWGQDEDWREQEAAQGVLCQAHSAGRVLRPGSCVRVALCRGQGGTPADAPRPRADTWQVVEMATFGGFVLRSLEPFHAPPGYQPRGYRGGAKGFHTDGALTHIFCLAGSAVPTRLSAACIRQDADCLADRIRSRMDNSEHVLGQTVHALAAALAVGSSQLVASFASGKRDRSSVASPWQARLVGRPEWSPSLPPWSHILDVSTTKEAVVTLAAVQELCHGRLTPLHCTDDGGCRLLCRDFHVATLHTPDSRSFVLEGGLRDILGDFPPSLTTFQGSLTLSVDIEVLAMLAGGLDDWRLLLSSPGVEPSLYPPRYSHDLSFWLDEHFDEALFLRLLRNAAGDVLRSVCLIDEYCSRGEGGGSGRQSRCYRLGYQSPWRALSAEAARDLHLALGAALDELLPSVQVR